MRISNIISKARDSLSDPNAERWSDARLLRLLSDAQEDIVMHHELLKTTTDIYLIIGQAEYSLPDDCYRILRCATDGGRLPLVSYNKLDEASANSRNDDIPGDTDWMVDNGPVIEAVVYDNNNPQQVRVYPIPNEDIADELYAFANAGEVQFAGDELYGIVTAIEGEPDYTLDSSYGVVTSLYDPSIAVEVYDSDYGVVTSIGESRALLRVWYSRKPNELLTTADELEIPSIYDRAMRYFVIANAYEDDFDAGNREKSARAQARYERELELAKLHQSTDGVQAQTHRTTYRTAF